MVNVFGSMLNNLKDEDFIRNVANGISKEGVKPMTSKEAIEVIKSNYPPENYTMLREALDLAIKVLEDDSKKEEWHNK